MPPDGGAGAPVRHFDYDVHPITGKSITPAQIKKKMTRNPPEDCGRHSDLSRKNMTLKKINNV